jgi:hypothetical protein
VLSLRKDAAAQYPSAARGLADVASTLQVSEPRATSFRSAASTCSAVAPNGSSLQACNAALSKEVEALVRDAVDVSTALSALLRASRGGKPSSGAVAPPSEAAGTTATTGRPARSATEPDIVARKVITNALDGSARGAKRTTGSEKASDAKRGDHRGQCERRYSDTAVARIYV